MLDLARTRGEVLPVRRGLIAANQGADRRDLDRRRLVGGDLPVQRFEGDLEGSRVRIGREPRPGRPVIVVRRALAVRELRADDLHAWKRALLHCRCSPWMAGGGWQMVQHQSRSTSGCWA